MGWVPSLPPPTGRVVSVRATRTLYGLDVVSLWCTSNAGLKFPLHNGVEAKRFVDDVLEILHVLEMLIRRCILEADCVDNFLSELCGDRWVH